MPQMWPSPPVKGDTLEDFNARVLYDKLEDQNLHLASQLARQTEDLEGFYKRICQQNEDLKRLLNNLDPEKMAALEARQASIERDGLQGAAALGGGATIVATSLTMGEGGKGGKFAGGLGLCLSFILGFKKVLKSYIFLI